MIRLDIDKITAGLLVGTAIGLLIGLTVIFGPIITGGPWIK